jgi:hypothetical protein
MTIVTLHDLPSDLYEFLKADAESRSRTFSEHVIVILEAYRQQVLVHRSKD